mmetsp:Transcript_15340/g.27136  ORF Transcript_15340/g.27136 Transcript_15340/m.27136 type:complete len:412 (+) Transcript_15340:95-1330(+)
MNSRTNTDNDYGVSGTEDVLGAFSSEIDREKLKQAILECTRAEVVRALNDILGGGNNIHSKPHRSSLAPHLHKQRPQTVEVTPRRLLIDRGHRPNTSHYKSSNDKPLLPQSLPLESIDVHADHTQIDRSSFNLLQRSSAIITKATGEPPKKFDDAFRDDGNHEPGKEAAPHSNNTPETLEHDTTETEENEPTGGETMANGLQQIVSWPEHFRPTTATRLLHTSHSVLRNKPSRRRPLTTTALERRKPPPSTAASERTKAQKFSKRLLGPITLEPKRPSYDFVVPNSLAANEWENELARNIINVFSNKARSEIKGEPPSEDVVQSLSPVIASNSLFSNNSAFHGNECIKEEEGDFQRISISREASCIDNTDMEFFVDSTDKERIRKTKKTRKRDLQNGTFRLKMIWFTSLKQ